MLQRWFRNQKRSDIQLLQTYLDISSTFELHKQVYIFNGFRAQVGGIQPEETGKSSPLLKKRQISSYCRQIIFDISGTLDLHKQVYIYMSDIKLLQTYLDIFSALELRKQVYIFNGSRA